MNLDMTDGDRYDQGCRDTRAVLMPEIERLRAALQYYATGIAGRGDIARNALGINEQQTPPDVSYEEVSTEQIKLMNEHAKDEQYAEPPETDDGGEDLPGLEVR